MDVAVGVLALLSAALWWVAGVATIRRSRPSWRRLSDNVTMLAMLCGMPDVRRVSLGRPAKDTSRFRFGTQVPPPGEVDAASDAYASLANAAAAFFAFGAAALVGAAALLS